MSVGASINYVVYGDYWPPPSPFVVFLLSKFGDPPTPFRDDIVYGRPPVLAPYRESLFVSYKGPAGFCIKKAC